MKNANRPALPVDLVSYVSEGGYPSDLFGLTKREMIAMNIMANIPWNATKENNHHLYEHAASSAVSMADALLEELNK